MSLRLDSVVISQSILAIRVVYYDNFNLIFFSVSSGRYQNKDLADYHDMMWEKLQDVSKN